MNRKIIWPIIYWIALIEAIVLLQARHVINSDEGIILEGAWNIINGRHLYTDFFEIITPGSFFLIVGIWKIVGVSYWAARIAGIVSVIFTCISVFMSSRLLTRHWSAYFGPVLIFISSLLWPMINHNVFFLPFAAWSIFFFIKSLNHGKPYIMILSGVLIGLATLILYYKGLLILGAAIIVLIFVTIQKRTSGAWKKILYYLFPVIFLISTIFIFWPVTTLYTNLIIPLFKYGTIQEHSFFHLTFFICIALCTLWMLRKDKRPAVRFLLLSQLLLLLGTASSPNIHHISMVLFPFFMLVPVVIDRLKVSNYSSKYLTVALYMLGFVVLVRPSWSDSALSYASSQHPWFDTVNVLIKQYCPGEYIYAGPWIPQVYFEARKLNPTPYYILIDGYQDENDFEVAKERLIKYKPSCVVISYSSAVNNGYTGNNVLEKYIRDTYTPLIPNQSWIVATRNPETSSTK